MTGISNFSSSFLGPMPLSFSSCGVLKVPPEMISSFSAVAEPGFPLFSLCSGLARYRYSPLRNSTPVAFGFFPDRSNLIFVTKQLVQTSRGKPACTMRSMYSRTAVHAPSFIMRGIWKYPSVESLAGSSQFGAVQQQVRHIGNQIEQRRAEPHDRCTTSQMLDEREIF